jgi:hypothetical protein
LTPRKAPLSIAQQKDLDYIEKMYRIMMRKERAAKYAKIDKSKEFRR